MTKNIVLEMKNLNIEGNVIDNGWIENLRYDNGKPNMNAIMILSEIVYWYKPTLVRDEITGEVKGYKKKFKADKLQKSYEALGDRIGITKRQAKACCDFLKKKGLITVEFRRVTVNGRMYNNVMFVEPVVENLKKITGVDRYLEEIVDDAQTSEASNTNGSSYPVTFECNTPPTFECNTPPTFECKTNTKNTNTKNTNTESISISSKGDKSPQAIRFESIMGKKLGVTTLPRFEEHIRNLDADLVEAILVYGEETGARSYQWFEDRVNECKEKNYDAKQFVNSIDNYRNQNKSIKNKIIKQKEERAKALDELHEREMDALNDMARVSDTDSKEFDLSAGEDVSEKIVPLIKGSIGELMFNVHFRGVDMIKVGDAVFFNCGYDFGARCLETKYFDLLIECLKLAEIQASPRILVEGKKYL